MRHFVFCEGDIILPETADIPAGQAALGWDGVPPNVSGLSVHKAFFRFDNTQNCAISINSGDTRRFAGFRRVKVRQLLGDLDSQQSALALTALAYANWANVSSYCGACGGALAEGRGEQSGAKVCVHCGRAFFPRISPAIIVLIRKEDRILLAHNVSFPEGRYGLIAGFVEVGETFEQTVRREVMEEAGIEIGDPEYVRSQPWPFPDSLMVAFEAEWKSGEPRPDGVEIGDLGWFRLDALPDIPPPGSVARFLIDRAVGRKM